MNLRDDKLNVSLNGRVLSFRFDNILLPDSSTNIEGSQGFVSFRIHTVEDLAEESVINNRAGIYFDNNPPVITNVTTNTMVSVLPVLTNVIDEDNDLVFAKLYPNPAMGSCTVEAHGLRAGQMVSVDIVSMDGRLISRHLYNIESRNQFSQNINLKGVVPGIYVVKLATQTNSLVLPLVIW